MKPIKNEEMVTVSTTTNSGDTVYYSYAPSYLNNWGWSSGAGNGYANQSVLDYMAMQQDMLREQKQSAALTLKRKTLLNELEKESVRIMSEAFSKRKKLNTRLSRTDALDIVRGKLTELAHKYNGNDIIKDCKVICDFSNNPVKENKVVVDVYLDNDSEDNFKRIELAR